MTDFDRFVGEALGNRVYGSGTKLNGTSRYLRISTPNVSLLDYLYVSEFFLAA
jgi:hypothetical protein